MQFSNENLESTSSEQVSELEEEINFVQKW